MTTSFFSRLLRSLNFSSGHAVLTRDAVDCFVFSYGVYLSGIGCSIYLIRNRHIAITTWYINCFVIRSCRLISGSGAVILSASIVIKLRNILIHRSLVIRLIRVHVLELGYLRRFSIPEVVVLSGALTLRVHLTITCNPITGTVAVGSFTRCPIRSIWRALIPLISLNLASV